MAARTIVWFRNDLRIHDNVILHTAATKFAENQIICLYCFDPRHFQTTKFESHKTGIYRARFLIESVINLRSKLRELGSDLVVTYNKPEFVIPKFLKGISKGNILVQSEVTSEELFVEKQVEENIKSENGLMIRLNGENTLYHPSDLPFNENFSDMPNTFTIFKEKIEKSTKIRLLFPSIQVGQLGAVSYSDLTPLIEDEECGFEYMPDLTRLGFSQADQEIQSDPRGVLKFIGGEDAAIDRLNKWIFKGDHLKDYFNIRNGMIGESYSSKFSPWMALGCLSPRYIYYESKRYEEERIANKSTYWMMYELTVRDFFRFLCVKYGNSIFKSGGAINIHKSWNIDLNAINRWKEGQTGIPLVDANMRELLHTGWMSNRGRQNVASYLVYDLKIDWRIGADHFESYLIDHDVCSNYGNWNASAGLTGGRINKFNITKQSNDYDPNGDYIRHWLPELKNVPAPLLFEPWKLSADDQTKYNVVIGTDYPHPIFIADSKHHYYNNNKNSEKTSEQNKNNKRKNRVQNSYMK